MKKEDLQNIGLNEEQAEKVIKIAKDEMKGFVPLERLSEVTSAKNKLEADLKERDKQLEELKKNAERSDKLKEQIDELQKTNKSAKEEYEKSIVTLKKDNALERALTNARAKDNAVVKPLLNEFLKAAEIDEKGNISGLDKEIEKLSKDEKFTFLFDTEKGKFKGISPDDGREENNAPSKGAAFAQKYNSLVSANVKKE